MEGINVTPKLNVSPETAKWARNIILFAIVYFFVTGQLRKWLQAKQYGQAGNDPNTAFAIQVRQACNPTGISLAIDIDGTWDNDLMLIADQISNVNKVNEAYTNLYRENMFERLEKELTATKFQEWLRRAQSAPVVQGVPGANVSKTLAATKDTVILSDNDSTKVVRTVKAGETIGTRLKAYSITGRSGGKNLYYLVSWNSFLFLHNQGLVLAADTKEI